MTSKERTLWNAAVALVDSNASLAIVGVLHPLEHSEVILEERQIEIEAPTNTKHHLTCGSPQALTPGGLVYGHSSSHIPPLWRGALPTCSERQWGSYAPPGRLPATYKTTERPGPLFPARSIWGGAPRFDSWTRNPVPLQTLPTSSPKTPRPVKGANTWTPSL